MRNPTRIHTFLAGALLLALSHCTITTDGDVASDVSEPVRAVGQMCGGVAGIPCDDGLDCIYEPGSCGAGDQAGTCRARPEVCTFIYDPVCGCDERTYANQCEAARSGVSIARRGPCGTGEGEPAMVVGSPGR